jgi:hypothetical protein
MFILKDELYDYFATVKTKVPLEFPFILLWKLTNQMRTSKACLFRACYTKSWPPTPVFWEVNRQAEGELYR